MSEFQHEIRDRLAAARRSLAEAHREDDEYLVRVRLGELESLERLAGEDDAERTAC
jgi:hypothetical protein